MSAFVAVLQFAGANLTAHDLEPFAATLKQSPDAAVVSDSFAAATWTFASTGRPAVAQNASFVAVGDVRLDNRREVERRRRFDAGDMSDLAAVAGVIAAEGAEAIPMLLGDFAFVLWDARSQRLIAARDAFGVKTIFYRTNPRRITLASRTDLLGAAEDYDEAYIADFLVGGTPPSERTIFHGIHAIGAGEVVSWRGSQISHSRYWSPADYAPEADLTEREAAETFRSLFNVAVRTRLADAKPRQAWAQLSGGLDSSSVVCMAESLVQAGELAIGLAGTVTMVDTIGSGDERAFSGAVCRRFGLVNRCVTDDWPWREDGRIPPRTDSPHAFYPFFARDRRMCDIVRAAGGCYLLSGMGSDNYLYGNLNFIADLVADRQLRVAWRALVDWSIATRQSFWRMGLRHVLYPFLPVRGRLAWVRPEEALPDWIEPRFASRLEMAGRLPAVRQESGRRGRWFADAVADEVARIPQWVDRGPFEVRLEVRYPFLFRPLVEFSMTLPPALRIRPSGRKWILRQAMRDLLPESVRTRTGKGGSTRAFYGPFGVRGRASRSCSANQSLRTSAAFVLANCKQP